MRSKLALLLALGLLWAAFPTLSMVIFGVLCSLVSAVVILAALVKAHLTFLCCIGAVVLLARTYPTAFTRTARWLGRAVADSVASVMPQKTDEA